MCEDTEKGNEAQKRKKQKLAQIKNDLYTKRTKGGKISKFSFFKSGLVFKMLLLSK